jgi:hypothetical protein
MILKRPGIFFIGICIPDSTLSQERKTREIEIPPLVVPSFLSGHMFLFMVALRNLSEPESRLAGLLQRFLFALMEKKGGVDQSAV